MRKTTIAIILKEKEDLKDVLKNYIKTIEIVLKEKGDSFLEMSSRILNYPVICSRGSFLEPHIKDKTKLNFCKLKDFDKDIDKTKYDKNKRLWEIVIEDQKCSLEELNKLPLILPPSQSFIDIFETKENFAFLQSVPHYWAFIVDGKMYEKGFTTSWGRIMTKGTVDYYFQNWLETINNPKYQDYYIVEVDGQFC